MSILVTLSKDLSTRILLILTIFTLYCLYCSVSVFVQITLAKCSISIPAENVFKMYRKGAMDKKGLMTT